MKKMKKHNVKAELRKHIVVRIAPWVLLPFSLAFLWLLCLTLAPFTIQPNSLNLGNDGVVGGHEHESAFREMNGFARFMYGSGDFNCHQKASRSIFLNGNQMPYCARDYGIFLGIALGLLVFTFIWFQIVWWWLLLCLVPIGVDGTLQLLTSYESNNPFRMITGLLAGIVTAYAITFIVCELVAMPRTWKNLRKSSRFSDIAIEKVSENSSVGLKRK